MPLTGGSPRRISWCCEDDKHDQPIYAPVPLIREVVLREYPQIAAHREAADGEPRYARRCSASTSACRSTANPTGVGRAEAISIGRGSVKGSAAVSTCGFLLRRPASAQDTPALRRIDRLGALLTARAAPQDCSCCRSSPSRRTASCLAIRAAWRRCCRYGRLCVCCGDARSGGMRGASSRQMRHCGSARPLPASPSVATALAAAANGLTPPRNKVVRVAPGAGFWLLLDRRSASWRPMRSLACVPGPARACSLLAVFLARRGPRQLAHGTFDNVSVMREYAVNAAALRTRGAAAHLLSLGSLGAAVIVALPLGIFCHRVPRLRAGDPRRAQHHPDDTVHRALRHPHGAPRGARGARSARGGRGNHAASAPHRQSLALFLYSLLPIVANTVAGLKRVSPATVEAALGMGMTAVADAGERRAHPRAAGHPHRHPHRAGAEYRPGYGRSAHRRRRIRHVRLRGDRPDGDRSGAPGGHTHRGAGFLGRGVAGCAGRSSWIACPDDTSSRA